MKTNDVHPEDFRLIRTDDRVCSLPPSIRALYTKNWYGKILIFGVSQDKNYTFVWNGKSEHAQEYYSEWKHEDDLYRGYRPRKKLEA